MELLKVYHGTNSTHAASNLSEGFQPGTCVTTSENLAWYYAECAFEEDNDNEDNDEVVLSTYVTIEQLEADLNAMAEPVGFENKTGSQIEEELNILNDFTSLKASLDICASARLKIAVEPENIQKV